MVEEITMINGDATMIKNENTVLQNESELREFLHKWFPYVEKQMSDNRDTLLFIVANMVVNITLLSYLIFVVPEPQIHFDNSLVFVAHAIITLIALLFWADTRTLSERYLDEIKKLNSQLFHIEYENMVAYKLYSSLIPDKMEAFCMLVCCQDYDHWYAFPYTLDDLQQLKHYIDNTQLLLNTGFPMEEIQNNLDKAHWLQTMIDLDNFGFLKWRYKQEIINLLQEQGFTHTNATFIQWLNYDETLRLPIDTWFDLKQATKTMYLISKELADNAQDQTAYRDTLNKVVNAANSHTLSWRNIEHQELVKLYLTSMREHIITPYLNKCFQYPKSPIIYNDVT